MLKWEFITAANDRVWEKSFSRPTAFAILQQSLQLYVYKQKGVGNKSRFRQVYK